MSHRTVVSATPLSDARVHRGGGHGLTEHGWPRGLNRSVRKPADARNRSVVNHASTACRTHRLAAVSDHAIARSGRVE
jgi:hypothetical protein